MAVPGPGSAASLLGWRRSSISVSCGVHPFALERRADGIDWGVERVVCSVVCWGGVLVAKAVRCTEGGGADEERR
ncbi:hypothetical protein K439DRAFT_1639288, partial [Ramaria rubella]